MVALLSTTAVGADKPSDGIILNFRDAQIRTLVEKISQITGKTILLDNKVRGAITVVSTEPVAREMVYDIFLSALRLHGFAVIEDENSVTILPAGDAKVATPTSINKLTKRPDDEIVTTVFPIQNIDAQQLLSLIKPYASAGALLNVAPDGYSIIITDFAINIRSIKNLISRLDKPVAGELVAINLDDISPHDLIRYYENLYVSGVAQGGAAKSAKRFSLAPDERANRLLVRSDDPIVVERLKKLAKMLGNKGVENKDIHVVPLDFANAKEVAAVLNETLSFIGQSEKGKKMSAIASEASKMVVVHAPQHVFRQITPLIERLDAERRQIYIEALIVEISTSEVAEFGIQWRSFRGMDVNRSPGPSAVGGVSLGSQGGNINGATANNWPGGLSLGVVSGVITLWDGTVIPNILALANALATKTQANILSTPKLMALDNEEAEIVVGQNVPFVTGSYAPSTGGASGTVAPFQTIERRDIGLSLKIKPQISGKGVIKLDIYQEVSSLLPTTIQTGASDVVTNKRSIKSTVIMQDGEMIVLGGLIQDDASINEDKVPFLGDLPILGHLFRYETRKRIKTNLLIFLQLKLIRTVEDSRALAMKSYHYIQTEQGDLKAYNNIMFPEMEWPLIPQNDQTPSPPRNQGKLENENKDGAAQNKTNSESGQIEDDWGWGEDDDND